VERRRIIFSGSGGQGIITAAIIFAEAAVLYEDLNAVQSQSYGPEARGGASRSDVIISDTDIHFPKVIQPNLLVCLTQEAYNKFSVFIRPDGLLLTDNHFVRQVGKVDANQVGLNMYQSVMETVGRPIVFNICMLGAFVQLTQLIRKESIMKVLEARIPPGTLGLNRQALELGVQLATDFKQ
jgi:2-oxoglutarate ferredoxin oxidoreductase subunit gamma